MEKKYLLTPSLIHLLLNTITATNIDGNNSDVFVSYSGHSEAKDNAAILIPEAQHVETDKDSITESHTELSKVDKPEAEDVVFIPNDKPIIRNGDEYLEHQSEHIEDVMNSRKIGDVIRDEMVVTEAAKEDIVFISGKNNENAEKGEKVENRKKHEDSYTKSKQSKDRTLKAKNLDCSNLDCENNVKSICGGKLEDKKWRYRLFLNECFFRKVNCAFKYPINRYQLVGLEKCSHIGRHLQARPQFQPIAMSLTSDIEETRRSFSSRRSLAAGIDGNGCSHPCPMSCPERYDPQCAVSSTGQHHTFLNHCKLDYNSCLYNVVWYMRPLSECVGGRKADMQQNRGFIAWMQKVGVVDNRGRLTLSKTPHPRQR